MRFSRKILYHWGGFINQMLKLYTYIKRNVYYAVFRGFKATTWYLFLKGTNLLKYIKVTYSQMFNRVQVWNCRFLPLGILLLLFVLLSLHKCATACYCMLLLSILHDAIVGACEVVKTSEQKVNLATSVVVLFFRASALVVCPGHCWSRNAWNFGTPAMRWQLGSQFPSHFLPKWPSAWAPSLRAPRLTKHVDEIGWILPLSRCCILTQDVCREKHMEHLVSCVQVHWVECEIGIRIPNESNLSSDASTQRLKCRKAGSCHDNI